MNISTPSLVYTSNESLQRHLALVGARSPATSEASASTSASTSTCTTSTDSNASTHSSIYQNIAPARRTTREEWAEYLRRRDDYVLNKVYFGKPLVPVDPLDSERHLLKRSRRQRLTRSMLRVQPSLGECCLGIEYYKVDSELLEISQGVLDAQRWILSTAS